MKEKDYIKLKTKINNDSKRVKEYVKLKNMLESYNESINKVKKLLSYSNFDDPLHSPSPEKFAEIDWQSPERWQKDLPDDPEIKREVYQNLLAIYINVSNHILRKLLEI